jgi:hypothetical protein
MASRFISPEKGMDADADYQVPLLLHLIGLKANILPTFLALCRRPAEAS